MKTQLPAVHGTVLGGDKLFKSELLKLCTRLGLMHTVQYSTEYRPEGHLSTIIALLFKLLIHTQHCNLIICK